MDQLWYREPAKGWNQALPIGNGRLGAMVYGGVSKDQYSLNEDTLWSGYPVDTNNHEAATYFKKSAALALDRKYREAQALIEDHMLGPWGQSYLPAGDLIIESDIVHYTEYVRTLDIEKALHVTSFKAGDVVYTREAFVSAPENMICIDYKANRPGHISVTVSLRSTLQTEIQVRNHHIFLNGQAPSDCVPSYIDAEDRTWFSDMDCHKGMTYCIVASIRNIGGEIGCNDNKLTVTNADSVEIRLVINTSFNGFDKHPFLQPKNAEESCFGQLSKALQYQYQEIKLRHISDYQALFGRVQLDLGKGREDLPTDERLKVFSTKRDDNGLYALLFQYGRYLLISSSRPGTQPANLQGIWNDQICPPWSCNCTSNINVQMNYWPALSCNLAECCEPVWRMLSELRVTGSVTAKVHYHAEGFCAHHNIDIWRLSSPVGHWGKDTAVYAFFPLGGAWLSRHLWAQYEYSLDIEFLRNKAYDIIKDSAKFCDSMLTELPDGALIFCPGTSPENSFIFEGGVCSVSATSTIFMSIVRDLFHAFEKSSAILCTDLEYAAYIKSRHSKLCAYKIGSQGQLLEWNEEFEEPEPHHRHLSHLYPLYPADIINPDDTPELSEACKKALEMRGDAGTGWSLAWKVNFWARLYDGNRALTIMNRLFQFVETDKTDYQNAGGTYPNLLCAHPPFQIDGNLGVTSGIAEMLIQSREGKILILPALPDQWRSGHVIGICAKGGIIADIKWADGSMRFLALHATHHVSFKLIYNGQETDVHLDTGEVGQFNESLSRII